MSDDIVADTNLAKFCIGGAIVVSLLTVTAVVVVYLVRPTDQVNMNSINTMIIGITGPIVAGLLAFGLRSIVTVVDGHTTRLVNEVAQKEHLRGALEGLAVNPNTNITVADVAPDIIGERRTNGTAEPPAVERRK